MGSKDGKAGYSKIEWDVIEGNMKVVDDPIFNPANPSHYKTKSMECRDIIKVMVEGLSPMEAVDVANIIKYLYRFKSKDGMKDLKKADEYLTFLMEDTEVGE